MEHIDQAAGGHSAVVESVSGCRVDAEGVGSVEI